VEDLGSALHAKSRAVPKDAPRATAAVAVAVLRTASKLEPSIPRSVHCILVSTANTETSASSTSSWRSLGPASIRPRPMQHRKASAETKQVTHCTKIIAIIVTPETTVLANVASLTFVGVGVGPPVGPGVGLAVSKGVGLAVGAGVGTSVSPGVGLPVGAGVGTFGGVMVASGVGAGVGAGVGSCMGAAVGLGLGSAEGVGVGFDVGRDVGIFTWSSREGAVVGTGPV
jgi:hypothetical protein